MRGDEKGEMGGWFGINSDAKPALSRKFGYAAGEGVQCPEVHHAMVVAVVGRSGIGMLTNIRIINYPFNYPSTWRLIIFMYFLYSLSKFLRYFTKKFVHKYTSNPKY